MNRNAHYVYGLVAALLAVVALMVADVTLRETFYPSVIYSDGTAVRLIE